MNSQTSPAAFNRRFSAYRRESESTDDGGIASNDFPVKREFRARIQTNKPSNPRMEFGAQQSFCTHQVFSYEDLSELKKEDMLRDEVTKEEYIVIKSANVGGGDVLWRVDVWKK